MLLALDTATRWTGIALHNGRQVIAESGWLASQNQTEQLAPRLAALLDEFRVAVADLNGVAVTIGPGSYTGLRIGLGLAKGLALVHDTPLLTVPTLDVIAAAVPVEVAVSLVVVIEAGRRRIIAGRFTAGQSGWSAEGRPAIVEWDALLGRLQAGTLLAGEIAPAVRSRLEQAGRGGPRLLPPAAGVRRAGWLAELGWARLRSGQTAAASSLAPDYLRPPEGS